jgi:predicted phosphodiesterase
VILGDRTGEAQPGVYDQVWREIAAWKPEFVVGVGDSIQGGADDKAAEQWAEWRRMMAPFAKIPLCLAPGNHDIWSAASEQLFRKFTGHAPHYSFDRGKAHFAILDNSRSDAMPDEQIAFLESDLKEHAGAPMKFVVSHRPSWIVAVALRNAAFPLHRLARQYKVRYVIAGHVHQMMRFELEGITYVSAPSAGGHLRASGDYKDGWFFGYIVVDAGGETPRFEVHELKPPHGQGRVTALSDWGMLGLTGK